MQVVTHPQSDTEDNMSVGSMAASSPHSQHFEDDHEESGLDNHLSQTIWTTCKFHGSRAQPRSAEDLPEPIPSKSWPSMDHNVVRVVSGSQTDARDRSGKLSESEVSLYEFIVRFRIPTAVANCLLKLIRDERFDSADLRFKSIETYHMHVFLEAKFGIRRVEMTAPEDGQQEVVFWHRSLWDIVSGILEDPSMHQHLTYNFETETNGTERVYSSFMGAKWMEAASALVRDTYPDCTTLAVVMGSDGTRIKNRLGAHPIYITLGNLSLEFRQGKDGWNLAGCVPERKRSIAPKQSDLQYSRRTRQILNMCVANVLHDINVISKEGGHLVKCGDGRTRRIILLWSLCITDRLEHEALCMVPAHSCFHCTVADHLKSQSKATEWPRSAPRLQQSMAAKAMKAASTGVYGEDDEWAMKIQNPLPILGMDETQRIKVMSEDRYKHSAKILGVCPEPNLLWSLPYSELYLICRDDPMHMMDLGVLQKLQEGMMARYIRYDLSKNVTGGVHLRVIIQDYKVP